MLNLNSFMNNGIKNISDTAGRFYFGNRRGQAFMLRAVSALHKSAKMRARHEQNGTHIPPFLIASIATDCNLRCAGCYAWASGACGDGQAQGQLVADDWRRLFQEASDIGISFVLIAGGEPLLRHDIIKLAAEFDTIIFPIFTNGTMIDEDYLNLFDKHRNLIPILSIEGDAEKTDARRGNGVSKKVAQAVERLKERGILFGASITVTTENQNEVTELSFTETLRENGCGLVLYVEYVPVEENTDHLILNENDLRILAARIDGLRENRKNKGMIILSFPGDEEAMGGCLAAGRGFFHINATGGAEPCPFSPYSDMNLKEQSLLTVLQSSFFEKVREISAAEALNHKGGCTLFQYKNEVKQAVI
ncbi:radical SAM protein [Desulfosporosinus sp. PR]|uniref:radical SAM protein n=1 Tax=Candidatus Desulfosporosinus nitrosoreducens TaxID=3401928 RepID=UPI0027F1807B|nr:radical SAM protein [Desulfosporosinus sp. PR]MDQ7094386.1 radical SAM protein [Desulfosporosinus sp. PR]